MGKMEIDGLEIAFQSWGDPENPKKLICFHGWLDNSNSFLPISNYLKDEFHLLAFDLPGHGLSGHLSDPSHYHFTDSLYVIEGIRRELKLEQISFLSHSLGAILSGLYAGVFPEKVKQVFSIEALGPIPGNSEETASNLKTYIEKRRQISRRRKRAHLSRESCIEARSRDGNLPKDLSKILVDRGVFEKDGEFFWRSDQRLLLPTSVRFTEEQTKNIMSNISCPYHLIAADNGFSILRSALEFRRSYIKNLSVYNLSGGHHIHMEKPEDIAKLVQKHYL